MHFDRNNFITVTNVTGLSPSWLAYCDLRTSPKIDSIQLRPSRVRSRSQLLRRASKRASEVIELGASEQAGLPPTGNEPSLIKVARFSLLRLKGVQSLTLASFPLSTQQAVNESCISFKVIPFHIDGERGLEGFTKW